MAVLRLAAEEGFIDLDNSHELAETLVSQSSSDAATHIPSGRIRAETHVAVNLKGADPFLAGQHQVNDAKPLAKVDLRVLENRPHQHREPIVVAGNASIANPMEGAGMRLDLRIAATWAHDRFRPAMFGQVQLASLFVREDPLEIADGHLSDRRLTPGLASHPRHSPTVNGA